MGDVMDRLGRPVSGWTRGPHGSTCAIRTTGRRSPRSSWPTRTEVEAAVAAAHAVRGARLARRCRRTCGPPR